jgi:hypothetical protein
VESGAAAVGALLVLSEADDASPVGVADVNASAGAGVGATLGFMAGLTDGVRLVAAETDDKAGAGADAGGLDGRSDACDASVSPGTLPVGWRGEVGRSKEKASGGLAAGVAIGCVHYHSYRMDASTSLRVSTLPRQQQWCVSGPPCTSKPRTAGAIG